MTSAEICRALVRTTLATAAAACLAVLLLTWLKIRSPRIHRVAWALVVVQGWLLVPWTFQIESPAPAVDAVEFVGGFSDADSAIHSKPASASQTPPTVQFRHPAPVNLPSVAILAWLHGGVGLALFAAWHYARIVRTLPLGVAPNDPEWQAEWRRELTSTRLRAELRITDRLGPLVAFVPFIYLVLAPRDLWAALTSRERRSILRHELAHLRRRDLWKSLAIRVLALPQWFNPFVWLAVRRFDEAAEWACDELAAHNHDPLTLANSLLRTAELCKGVASPPRAAGFIPAVPNRSSKLSRRIHRLVTPRFKEESIMRKLAVPALLAALAAVQLIRIEHVAAGDPATPVDATAEEVARFTADGAITLSAAADAELRLEEFEEIAERPYVIEPPDTLLVQFSMRVDANEFDGATPGTKGLFQTAPEVVLVNPEGRIELGELSVFVAGLTVDEARGALEQELEKRCDDAQATVEVASYNSKVCYVIDQRGKSGDVARLSVPYPMTVDFNVGAALAQTQPREFDLADARIWVARPAVGGVGSELALPVAWDAATDAPAPETNHPLLPGDRVFVEAPATARQQTIAPHDQLAVTFRRADGARLDLNDPEALRGKPGVIVSQSADSITFLFPVDDNGSVDFQVWFKSGAIEVAGKTFDEAGQAIHDGVLGTQDRDYTVVVDPAVTWPAAPPKLAAAAAPVPEALPDVPPTSVEEVRNGTAFRGNGQRFHIDPAPGSETARYLMNGQAAAPAPKPLPHDPPPRPTTTAKDPGPNAVVTLVLRLAKDREVEQPIEIAGPTTLGDLLASATYPEPIDFAAAMITLTRSFGPPELGGTMEVAVGWEETAQRPAADSDYGLEDGDVVTINLVGPPKGTKIYAEPLPPRKAKPATAKPQAAPEAAEAESGTQLEFQLQFIEDASGALADFEFPGRGGGMTVGESRAVLSALRVFRKHKLTATESYPVIRTELGRPASFNELVPTDAEDDRIFRVTRSVTVRALPRSYGRDLSIEVQARAGDSEIDTGFDIDVGQTAIIQLPPADGGDDLPVHYIVVTPRWVE